MEYDEVNKVISDLYIEREDYLVKKYNEEFETQINILRSLNSYFILLITALTDKDETEEYKGRVFISMNYLGVIANNFHVSRKLFERGLHVQLHPLFRSQFEYVNAIIAYVGDQDYFKRFGKENKELNTVLTPKPIHTEKAIRKILKGLTGDGFKLFWEDFKEIMDSIYSNLSTNAHGNILSVSFQSLGLNSENEEILEGHICGVSTPIEATVGMLNEMLNYFQITRGILFRILAQQRMLDTDKETYDFLYSKAGEYEIL